jgi:hypothetical protein
MIWLPNYPITTLIEGHDAIRLSDM